MKALRIARDTLLLLVLIQLCVGGALLIGRLFEPPAQIVNVLPVVVKSCPKGVSI